MWVISRQVINTWCELFTYKETSLTIKSSCTQTMHILQAIWSILFSFQVLEVQESPFLFFKITYFSTKFFFVKLLLLFVLVLNLVFVIFLLFFMWIISHQVINTWCELFTYKETSLTLKSSCTHTVHVLQAI